MFSCCSLCQLLSYNSPTCASIADQWIPLTCTVKLAFTEGNGQLQDLPNAAGNRYLGCLFVPGQKPQDGIKYGISVWLRKRLVNGEGFWHKHFINIYITVRVMGQNQIVTINCCRLTDCKIPVL